MAAYQKAVSATFASAAARIRGSIDFLDNAGEPLDAWQSDMLARALAYLQVGNYACDRCCLSSVPADTLPDERGRYRNERRSDCDHCRNPE